MSSKEGSRSQLLLCLIPNKCDCQRRLGSESHNSRGRVKTILPQSLATRNVLAVLLKVGILVYLTIFLPWTMYLNKCLLLVQCFFKFIYRRTLFLPPSNLFFIFW